MKSVVWSSAATAACLLFMVPAHAQKVVAYGDEWVLSDTAFVNNTTNTTNFALNLARAFGRNNGTTGNFLVYSTNFGLTGTSLATTMTGAGYGWTVSTAQPFTLTALSAYDGVFLAGIPGSGTANATILQSYVNGGGNVFVEAGAGEHGGAADEAAAWNPFLNRFGLSLGNSYFDSPGLFDITLTPDDNPLQTNVTAVSWGYGQAAFHLNAADTQTASFSGQFGSGNQPIIATYNVGASVAAPEPSGLAFLIGSLPFVRYRRFTPP